MEFTFWIKGLQRLPLGKPTLSHVVHKDLYFTASCTQALKPVILVTTIALFIIVMEFCVSIAEFSYQEIQMPEDRPTIVNCYRSTYWIGFCIPIISGVYGSRLIRCATKSEEYLNYLLTVTFLIVLWSSFCLLGIYLFYVKFLH